MHLSPDDIVFYQNGFVKLNGTIVFTWVVMFIMVVSAWLVTRRFTRSLQRSRWQNAFEVIVSVLLTQLEELGLRPASRYLGFLGTLFLFLAVVTLLTIIPFYEPPTGSLSTTVALALSVFIAVPMFGIRQQGVRGYLRTYVEPTAVMLPFHIIGECFRTLALAVRLFGNMMSGAMIVAILLAITPFVFPIVMLVLGLLTGIVQAYIFTILASVYIAAATQGHGGTRETR
jgi:F-type H+-transporting ATPase subunit a